MSDHPSNVVRRQFLEVDLFGAESDGLALQHRLPDVCNRLVAPALDRALTRFAPEDGWLLVERLDVDLGSMSQDDLERDLPEAVGRAVGLFLRNNPPAAPDEATAQTVRLRTNRQTADEALLVFLRTGRLPWSFRLPPGRHLEHVLLTQWTATDLSLGPGRRAAMLDALAASVARRRLVGQFSTDFLRTLVRMLSAAAADAIATCLDWIYDGDRVGPAVELLRAHLWDAAFVSILSANPTGPSGLLAVAWRAVPPDVPGRAELHMVLAPHLAGVVTGAAPEAAALTTPSDPSNDGVYSGTRRDHPRRHSPAAPISADDDVDDVSYIDNAGIVLLHPFLPRFFDALGICAGDSVVQPDRALALLHHLATGELAAPEYELTLGKVLCNVPLAEPVAAVTPNAEEIAESSALLAAVIRNWSALRNTGPDALRGTFLMRPGRLSRDVDGDWLLQVEVQTVDILLDQLPWGISMIQTPWMQHLLRVEWR